MTNKQFLLTKFNEYGMSVCELCSCLRRAAIVMKIAAAIYSSLHAKSRESRPAREYNGFCLGNEIKINLSDIQGISRCNSHIYISKAIRVGLTSATSK